MSKKIAVVLFNLGGPSDLDSVGPFLFNLFYDEAIISLPNPFRYILAKFISWRRKNVAQNIYRRIGNKSPIFDETRKQANCLENSLNEIEGVEYKVFISMRYWKPFASEVVISVEDYAPDEVVLLPLYPQYSLTTTGSSVKDWFRQLEKRVLDFNTVVVNNYHDDEGFIRSHVVKVKEYYEKAKKVGKVRVLFSAHGLPKKIIEGGDPYQEQVENTVRLVVDGMGVDDLDWCLCYQSKVGPLEWIGPSLDDEIVRAGQDKVVVVVVPIAFVSEHSETLVELDIEYKEIANDNGVCGYYRVPALSDDVLFVESLKKICCRAEDYV